MFHHILFDFDNTLYNYDVSNKLALTKVLEEVGKDFGLEVDQLRNTFTREKAKVPNLLLRTRL